MADITFWGIVSGFWFITSVVVWRFFNYEGDIPMKIAYTIISFPVIMGICYLMGTNG
jgi:hypothetical protein